MRMDLQDVLYNEIPITRAMGITLSHYDGTTVSLSAPLDCNKNHKRTAFGGSLYSILVLSGWSLIFLLLRQHNLAGQIVIQESDIQYLKPVTEDIDASCSFDSPTQSEKLIRTFQRRGAARVQLRANVTANSVTKVRFRGSYVVLTE